MLRQRSATRGTFQAPNVLKLSGRARAHVRARARVYVHAHARACAKISKQA